MSTRERMIEACKDYRANQVSPMYQIHNATLFSLIKKNWFKARASLASACTWCLKRFKNTAENLATLKWHHLARRKAVGIEMGGHTPPHPTFEQVIAEQTHRESLEYSIRITSEPVLEFWTFLCSNVTLIDFSDGLMKQVGSRSFRFMVPAFSESGGVKQRFALSTHVRGNRRFQFCSAVSVVELIDSYLGGQVKVHS